MPPQQSNPSSGIKWNEVTWYSKLGAVVLFIGVVPALCFYIGTQYELAQQTMVTQIPDSIVVQKNTNSLVASTTVILDAKGKPSEYATDGVHVYFNGGPNYYNNVLITGADPKTFTPLMLPDGSGDSVYAKDKNGVYFNFDSIQGADPISFKVLDEVALEGGDDAFAKDKNQAYFYGSVISGADPTTFNSVNPPQSTSSGHIYDAQDKNHKYYQDQVIQ